MKKDLFKKMFGKAMLAVAAVGLIAMVAPAAPAQAKNELGQTVIVLDPGHGGTVGEDLGAIYDPFVEKAMTMQLSAFMYQELMQYDNVAVYMTRWTDESVSLKDRVDYAQSVGADFLASIHFNVSNGTKNGAEVYVTVDQNLFPKEAFFAQTELSELSKIGLDIGGIKFRASGNGDRDYYGILRRASLVQMEAALIEHCYLNGQKDRAFLSQENAVQQIAHADVTAVAKHLQLRSKALGVDYSSYVEPAITYSILPFE